MKKLLLVAAATMGIGLFAPQANAGHDRHHHDRDYDDHSYRSSTRVYHTYRYYDNDDYDGYRCQPRVYYRPEYYEYRPVYHHRPSWSFFFGF